MARVQTEVTYLKQGFQWAAGLWVYANVLCFCVHGSLQDLLLLNGVVVLPIICQIMAIRVKKWHFLFDGLMLCFYGLILWHYVSVIRSLQYFYVWLIFVGSLIIVGRYFIRLRYMLLSS